MYLPCTWKEWSELAQVVAVSGGLLFILIKGIFGYFMINLSVEPSTSRQRGRDRRTDDIQLNLKLMKGDREGVTLDRIVVHHKTGTLKGSAVTIQEVFTNPNGGRFKLRPGEIASYSYHLLIRNEAQPMTVTATKAAAAPSVLCV